MGLKAFSTIVSDGLQMAGAPHLADLAGRFLLAFLRDVYAKFEWPFIKSRYGPYTIPAGTQSFTFGAGSIGIAAVTEDIKTVKRIDLTGTLNNEGKVEIPILTGETLPSAYEPLIADTNSPGAPFAMLVEWNSASASAFSWKLSPYPVPDKSYRVIIHARGLPGDESAGTPRYPNDLTMTQAIYRWASYHEREDDAALQDSILQGMVRDDFSSYGRAPGQPLRHRLGPSFRKKW